MAVRRIVANMAVERIGPAKAFYSDALEMNVVMDLGWITIFAADGSVAPQISVATEGGSGTPVPDLSIEVDDLAETLRRMQAGGFTIEYGPVAEPWGIKRFTSVIRSGVWSIFWSISDCGPARHQVPDFNN